MPCLGPTDPLVHYNRVFDVVRVVGSQQRALAFLAGIDFDEPHCCVATLLVGTYWSVFYTVFPQKGFFTWLGNGRPNECCSHLVTKSELQYFSFFGNFDGFVTSLQLQQLLISVTGHCG